MACRTVQLPGGSWAVVCGGARSRPRECSACHGKTRDSRLCDFPVGGGKTCDAVICPRCATHQAPDVDFCPAHAKQLTPEARLKL